MKGIISSVLVALVLIGGAIILTKKDPVVKSGDVPSAQNVEVVDGLQIINIRAKGGYQPRKSIAKADLPTVIRFDSKGTFDCSASVRIPSLNISQSLNFSGLTDVDLGKPKMGVLKGSCSMGMYPFEIVFQS